MWYATLVVTEWYRVRHYVLVLPAAATRLHLIREINYIPFNESPYAKCVISMKSVCSND